MFTVEPQPGIICSLVNPKFPQNVAMVVRAAACFGVGEVRYSGERMQFGARLPREFRLYKEVTLVNTSDMTDGWGVPVAIEFKESAESLCLFDHPEEATYIFGPEDGSIPKSILSKCHRIVQIPTNYCANLASSVYMVLYDRLLKRTLTGL